MEKRNIGLAIVLSFVTCGIYCLYWQYVMTNEVHALVGRETTATGGMAILYTILSCGIYAFYWMYKMGESVSEIQEQRGLRVENNAGLMYVVLTAVGLAIVSYALIQNSINNAIDHDNGQFA